MTYYYEVRLLKSGKYDVDLVRIYEKNNFKLYETQEEFMFKFNFIYYGPIATRINEIRELYKL